MSTASDTTTDIIDDPVSRLSDFSDRLSPIVVKEMRQGLRQASFVILFLFLQSVLAMAVISSLFSVSSGTLSSRMQTGSMISTFFFVLFGVAVLIIQPLRGLNALSSEVKDQTIDLLLLTKLDAWRIVFGKWLSLVTQSGLLLVAVIPYLMMRYFLGGMNLLGELFTLLVMFLLGSMATAAAVGMSSVRSIILRSIFAAVGIFAFIVLLRGVVGILEFRSMMGGSMGGSTGLTGGEWFFLVTGGLLMIGYLTQSFLEFGATRIAPPSENRSKLKRLVAFGAVIIIPIIFAFLEDSEYALCYFAIAVIAPLALADALSENPHHVRPMKKMDFWMLRPGWPSGALFGLVMLMICAIWMGVLTTLAYDNTRSFVNDGHIAVAQVVSILILIFSQPVFIIAMFRPYDREPANAYIASMLGAACLGLVILTVSSSVSDHEMVSMVLFPLFPVLAFGNLGDPSVGKAITTFFVAALYLLGAVLLGYQRWNPALQLMASSSQPSPEPSPEVPVVAPESPTDTESDKNE